MTEQPETQYLEDLTDAELNDMSDDKFQQVVDTIPKMSNNQMRHYMRLMNRHKPVNEIAKAARKVSSRKKNKAARNARRTNR